VGQQWRCLCPAHDDHNPSLGLRDAPDGGLLWYCRSGCSQRVVGLELRRRGLLADGDRERRPQWRVVPDGPRKNQQAIDSTRPQWLELWCETEPFPGSPGAIYLEKYRGVSYDGDALRWHPSCSFGKDRVGCMVALVRNIVTNEPQAIQRTAIDGRGRKLSHLGGNGRLSLGRPEAAPSSSPTTAT
jgi:hypothetical protein